MTGGIIIMPTDMRPAETTMSITRNGTKMTNPMMNALFSSDSTNAGTSAFSGTLSRATGVAVWRYVGGPWEPLRTVPFGIAEGEGR